MYNVVDDFVWHSWASLDRTHGPPDTAPIAVHPAHHPHPPPSPHYLGLSYPVDQSTSRVSAVVGTGKYGGEGLVELKKPVLGR